MSYDYLIYLEICKHFIDFQKNRLNSLKYYNARDFKTKKVERKVITIKYTGSFSTVCAKLKYAFDNNNLDEKELELYTRICSNLGIVWCLTDDEIFNYIKKFLARKDVMEYYKVAKDELAIM